MATKLAFLSLLVLSCVTLVSCRGKPHTPPASSPNQDAWKNYIHQTCLRFGASCVSQWEQDMLSSAPKGALIDDQTVVYLAVNVSVRSCNALFDFMNGVVDANNWGWTPKDINAAQKCLDELHPAFVPLTTGPSDDPKSVPDLPGFLKGLSAPLKDCLNSAKTFQKNTTVAAGTANYAVQSTNIAIGLVNGQSNNNNATTLTFTVPTAPPPQPTTLTFTIPTKTPPPTQAPAGGASPVATIRDACTLAAAKDYVQQCQDDMLQGLPNGVADMSAATVAFLSANVSVRRAESYLSSMNKIISDKTATQVQRGIARKCVTELNQALAPLDNAPGSNPQYLDDTRKFLKDLATAETDCQTSAAGLSAGYASAADDAKSALASTNIALYLVGNY